MSSTFDNLAFEANKEEEAKQYESMENPMPISIDITKLAERELRMWIIEKASCRFQWKTTEDLLEICKQIEDYINGNG